MIKVFFLIICGSLITGRLLRYVVVNVDTQQFDTHIVLKLMSAVWAKKDKKSVSSLVVWGCTPPTTVYPKDTITNLETFIIANL